MLARLRDGDTIQNDVALTEERVKETIGHGCVVLSVHILSRNRDQFTSVVEFDIKLHVRIDIVKYKKFQIILIHRAKVSYADSQVPSTGF